MRLKFVAAVAMLSACFAAHADTIVETFSVSGTAVENDSGAYGIDSTAIADFNTSLGTLNSITIVLSGEATNIDGGINQLLNIVSGSAVQEVLLRGSGATPTNGLFAISADGSSSDSSFLGLFEGSGTQELVLNLKGTATIAADGVTGTLTYNYTPLPITVTPEPSSFALLGTGLLGVAGGVMRKRFA